MRTLLLTSAFLLSACFAPVAVAVVVAAVAAVLARPRVNRGIERRAVSTGNALALLRQVAITIDVDTRRRLTP